METIHPDLEHDNGRDRGATTVEYLGWAAMMTVAIVAIGAAMQALGLEVVGYVREQLGI